MRLNCGVGKAIDIGNFLRAANVVTLFRSYARAFITLVTDGAEAGMKAFRFLSTVFKWAGGNDPHLFGISCNTDVLLDTETLEETSKLARYAANASRFLKVLAIVGIFVDAFILAFDVSIHLTSF